MFVQRLTEAAQLEEDAPCQAETQYRELIKQTPQNVVPQIGLARVLVIQDKDTEAKEILDELSQRGLLGTRSGKKSKRPSICGARKMIALRSIELLPKRLPTTGSFNLQLAMSLAGAQQYEECLEICLKLVEKDRQATGEEARKLMIEIFQSLPDDSELTTNYRRQLSQVMY